jgi:hypothetical protein
MVYMWQHFWYTLKIKKNLDTLTNSWALILIKMKIDEMVIEFGIT